MKKHANGVIDIDLLMSDLSALGRFGALATGGISRPAYSASFRHAQDWLLSQMAAIGMTARTDSAGNIIGRLGAADGPALVCGSHIDTVPEGGAYDGALGVLAGLAVARALAPQVKDLPAGFEVIAFSDEEGAYLSEAGARAMTGELTAEAILESRGRDGTAMAEAVEAFGLPVAGFTDAARPASDFLAYLELHIEQGPVLESLGMDIGVVENIVGLHTSELTFKGQANHAGTTPLHLRKDAFRAAAETVSACFERLENSFPPETRLTFGKIDLQPGATNVVPSSVALSCEIRAASEALIESVAEETAEIAKSIAAIHDVDLEIRLISREAPAVMSETMVAALEEVCKQEGRGFLRMDSGAGHDAQVMAHHCPTGMLLVPSRDGISHNPAEFTSPEQIEIGANLLLAAVHAIMTKFQAPKPT